MTSAAWELVWLKQLLRELQFGDVTQMRLVCDNQVALHISVNFVFHERTKHIEIDYHFIREKIMSGDIKIEFVNSNDQLVDIFTKSLRGLELIIFVTSLAHTICMLQLGGKC